MKLRLWSDLYLIQGRYIVFMGIPIKTSSLNDFKWPRCNTHPYMAAHLSCPTGSSQQGGVLTSFVLPIHNQGASSAIHQGRALRRRFLPATSSFFVTTLLIQTLALQHLPVDASCNGHGCFVFRKLMLPFGQPLPDAGYRRAFLMHHSLRLL